MRRQKVLGKAFFFSDEKPRLVLPVLGTTSSFFSSNFVGKQRLIRRYWY
jgi:hypothetical protein